MASILPIKFIPSYISDVVPDSFWLEDDGSNDPHIGKPYRWVLQLSVTPQPHSSHITNTPFIYDGLDVKPGMWIADINSVNAVQIVEVQNQSYDSLTLLVEDVERYNTFSDNSDSQDGNGTVTAYADAFIFEINDEGIPLLPFYGNGTVLAQNPSFLSRLQSRFAERNLKQKYIQVVQPNHNFTIGQLIKPDVENPGNFIAATADENVDMTIGVISSVGINGVDSFTFESLGKIVYNVEPELNGNFGDLYYLDPNNPGNVTNIKPDNFVKPVYMRLNTSRKAIRFSYARNDNTESKDFDYEVETNNQTEIVLPNNAKKVLKMTINGIDTNSYTFNPNNHTVTFNPNTEGFSLEITDSISFLYST